MRRLIVILALCILAAPAHAGIRAKIVEATYAISGSSGKALYVSIGERGPKLRGGASSAVAKTDFDLKWIALSYLGIACDGGSKLRVDGL